MTCALADCTHEAYCRGLCRSHYVRWRRQGKPEPIAEWAARGGHLLRPCVVCGTPCRALRGKEICSDACARERQRRRDLEHYYRSEKRRRQLLENAKRRRRKKPEQARAQDRRKWARIKADPERLAKARERNRNTYARHAERIQAERRARLDAMSPDELREWCERARRYVREWRRRWREKLRANPEAHRRWREVYNEYKRRWRAERSGPPPARRCVVCGAVFTSHKLRVLCGSSECKAAYHRDCAARSRARKASAEFLEIERELERLLQGEGSDGEEK